MTQNQFSLPLDIVTLGKKGKFLTLVDATQINRVKVQLTEYEKGQGAQRVGEAYISIPQAHGLIMLAEAHLGRYWEIPHDTTAYPLVEVYGGSGYGDQVVSRCLKASCDTAGGKMATLPFRVEITSGPGIRGANGAIQPDPQAQGAKETVFIRLSVAEMATLIGTLKAFLYSNGPAIFQAQAAIQAEKRAKRQQG